MPPSLPPSSPSPPTNARVRCTAKREGKLARQAGESRGAPGVPGFPPCRRCRTPLDLGETLRSLCSAAVPRLGQWCSIALRSDGGPRRAPGLARFAGPQPSPPGARRAAPVRGRPAPPGAPRPGFRALRVRRPHGGRLHRASRDVPGTARLLHELDIHSYMCVPLRLHGKTLGAMTLGADAGWRPLCRTDLVVAEQLATRAAPRSRRLSFIKPSRTSWPNAAGPRAPCAARRRSRP